MKALYCIAYLAGLGIMSHFVGEALPRQWFHYERFPYREYRWEKQRHIYERFKVQTWKDHLPDMSSFCPDMTPKRILSLSLSEIDRLIKETCVAEATHLVLMILSIPAILVFNDGLSTTIAVIWIVSNLPFIMIQRYNRPRLIRLAAVISKKNVPA